MKIFHKGLVLVTGASGCVGSNLVQRLFKEGYKVHILILPNTWHPFLDGLNLKVFYGDVRNKSDVIKAMKGCSKVYHVAGVVSYNRIDHQNMYTTHVHGTHAVLEAAKELGVKKVVVTASTAGIGIPEDKNRPLDENAPFDFKKYRKVMYMYSKYLAIKECQKIAKQGLNVSIVSPTSIYGQGDTDMHIGKVVKKIKEGKIKYAPLGGNAVISVDDVIDAHLLVMEKGRKGENYIFAGEFIPYIDMFNRIAKLLGKQQIKKKAPPWILPYAKFILGVIENTMLIFGKKPALSPHSLNFTFKFRYFDSSKARRELGWKPKVGFEETMLKAIQFYKDNNLL